MLNCFSELNGQTSVAIVPIIMANFDRWLQTQDSRVKNLVKANSFSASSAEVCLLHNMQGELERVLLGLAHADDFWAFGFLPSVLPEGVYKIEADFSAQQFRLASLAWALGSYQFKRYKKGLPKISATLVLDIACQSDELNSIAEATYLVRDLVNTPAEDMGPSELADAAENLAKQHKAKFKQWVGDDLLARNYPTIHAVGRACDDPPRLVELTWGDKHAPLVTLVGKGVCFDTGGLDIKTAKGMLSMKKDMGGAAHCLGLAHLIMSTRLSVRLRVLLPIVENSVSGDSLRPSDVITTRKGITVEVLNTDAEGRLILCDALAEACGDKPELLIDFATLTGAARVALGTGIAALFSDHNDVVNGLMQASACEQDPVWRLPLFKPYLQDLESKVSDIANTALHGYGGAINAGLFLQQFVDADVPWVHFDIHAANEVGSPGRPEGGEAYALRCVYSYLKTRFS